MPSPVHLISKVGDPLFAAFIGISAATLRINREEKEKGELVSPEPTIRSQDGIELEEEEQSLPVLHFLKYGPRPDSLRPSTLAHQLGSLQDCIFYGTIIFRTNFDYDYCIHFTTQMATHSDRRLIPTSAPRLTESAGNQRALLRPDVTERTIAKPIPMAPIIHGVAPPGKVHFADLPAPNRPARWSSKKLSTDKIIAESLLFGPPHIPQLKENNLKAGESSKLPGSDPIIRPSSSRCPPDLDINHPVSNPFADPDNGIEPPDLCEDENDDPFRDEDSASSASSLDSSHSGFSLPEPAIRIVDNDRSGLITPAATPVPDPDYKEDQAFFVALEQFNHPDIARSQFRCRGGMLWNSAIRILMSSFLHPVDLTEDEFVTLVCSQGNATSHWLKANARKISSRVITTRLERHRELTNAGLPPKRMTDEFLELYETLDHRERTSFLDWLQELKDDVELYQKSMDLTDAVLEKYLGMTLIEKAKFIGLFRLEQMRLDRAEKDLEDRAEEDLEEISTMQLSSSTDSTGSFGEPLKKMGPRQISFQQIVPSTGNTLTEPAAASLLSGISLAFESHKAQNSPLLHGVDSINLNSKPTPRRKLSSFPSVSNLVAAVGEFADGAFNSAFQKFHGRDKSQASQGRSTTSVRSKIDSGSGSLDTVDEATNSPLSTTPFTHSLFDDCSPGRVERIKSGLLNGMTLPNRRLNRTKSHRDIKNNFRLASFDSDAVPLDKFGENLSTAKKGLVTTPNLVEITPARSVPVESREQQGTTAQEHANAKQELASKPSRWFQRPRRRRSVAQLDETELLNLESEFGLGLGKKRTLRKKLSTMLGTVKAYGKTSLSEAGNENGTVRRRISHRKELPSWEFSK